jgi:hypothetical protein
MGLTASLINSKVARWMLNRSMIEWRVLHNIYEIELSLSTLEKANCRGSERTRPIGTVHLAFRSFTTYHMTRRPEYILASGTHHAR